MTLRPRTVALAGVLLAGLMSPLLYSEEVVRYSGIIGVYAGLIETLLSSYFAIALASALSFAFCSVSYLICRTEWLGAIDDFLAGLRSVPSIAWLPFLVLVPPLILGEVRLLGGVSGRPGAVLFAAASAWPLISSHMLHAFLRCQPALLYLGNRGSVPGTRVLTRVVLPASSGELIQGVRYGASLSFILVVVHEQIIGGGGLGSIVSFIEVIHLPVSDAAITTIVVAVSGVVIDSSVRMIGWTVNAYLSRPRLAKWQKRLSTLAK